MPDDPFAQFKRGIPSVASFPRPGAPANPSIAQPANAFGSAFAPYDPPITAPVPQPPITPSGVGNDYESVIRTIAASDIPQGATLAPLSVYATQRRWRAIDVYVSTTIAGAALTYVSIGIFAIARGVRTLVATGRVFGSTTGTFSRIAVARVVAERFEVVIQKRGTPASNTMNAQVAIVASDEADDFDPTDSFDGVILTNILAPLTTATTGITDAQGQLTGGPVLIEAINTSGAVRYIQLANTVAAATLASFMIAAGGTLRVTDPRELVRFRSSSTLVIRESSTPEVFTVTADTPKQMWWR